MEEPTCEIHAFSYSSAVPNEATQEDPMYAMGDSVSFGRFTTESLSWEKWSAFNRNRYVEEAEKYSRPGSVMQKKAFLEAHFKKKAGLKADADSSDQEITAQEAVGELYVGETAPGNSYNELILSSPLSMQDQQCIEKEAAIGTNQNEDEPNNGDVQSSSINIAGANELEQIQQTEDLMDVENQNPDTETENQMTKSEKSSSINQEITAPALVKRNPPLSSYIPSVEAETSLITSSSPAAVHPAKELDKKSQTDNPDKKAPLYILLNRKLGRFMAPVMKKIGISSHVSNKSRPRTTPKKKPDKLWGPFCFGSNIQSKSFSDE